MRFRRIPFVLLLQIVVGLLLAADILLVVPQVRSAVGLAPPLTRRVPAPATPTPPPVAAVVRSGPAPAAIAVSTPPPGPARVATPRSELPAAGIQVAPTAPAAVPAGSLDGRWTLSATVDRSKYKPYEHLATTYELVFAQDGARVSAHGRKVSENGKPLRVSARSPISVEGTLSGSTLEATWVMKGSRRPSRGTFRWTVSPSRDRLEGPFTSDVAESRGHSAAFRSH